MGTYRYVIPHLKHALGLNEYKEFVILEKSHQVDIRLTFFLPVRITNTLQGQLKASFVDFSGSGDFGALSESDGFVELPSGSRVCPEGFVARFYRWQ